MSCMGGNDVSQPTGTETACQAPPAPVVAPGYEWLRDYCDPEDKRPACTQPWAATFYGAPWTFACDGKAILFIAGTYAEVNDGMGAVAAEFYDHLGERPVRTDLDSLKAWCACPPPVAREVTCPHCKQPRTTYERPIEYGRLCGKLIDRRRLGTALARFTGGAVDVYCGGAADDFILLVTRGWRLALMPCRDDKEQVTNYPAAAVSEPGARVRK